jgi:hypothetical protein
MYVDDLLRALKFVRCVFEFNFDQPKQLHPQIYTMKAHFTARPSGIAPLYSWRPCGRCQKGMEDPLDK